jgi:hypothetical protein
MPINATQRNATQRKLSATTCLQRSTITVLKLIISHHFLGVLALQYAICVRRIALSVCKGKHSHPLYLSFEPSLDSLFSGNNLFTEGNKNDHHYITMVEKAIITIFYNLRQKGPAARYNCEQKHSAQSHSRISLLLLNKRLSKSHTY